MVEGMKKAVSLIEDTTTYKRFEGRFTNVSFPGCEHIEFKSDAYYECYARQLSITLHHIVGGCSMGAEGEGVVDTQLRVRGIRNLRVIDASVMPQVVVGELPSEPSLPEVELILNMLFPSASGSR
jgi:hypothetical protein